MVARSGQIIKGYELHEKVAETGFAMVYRATQLNLKREVAVKIILPTLAKLPEFVALFDQEAKIIARLEHMNIVPLIDYWRDQEGAYLVMRWMKGGNLRQKLEHGPLKVEEISKILDQIGNALAFAHANKVLHRDIKPENILLDELGNAYLADFGIAKDLGASNITPTSEIRGTPGYLGPERFDAKPASPQSDIYSLGIMLYELLTGVQPYAKMSPQEMLYKKFNAPMPHLNMPSSELSARLDKVIQRTTRKDPRQRYSDVMQLVEAFRTAMATTLETSTAEMTPVLPPQDESVITPIIVSDLKARLYQKSGLIPDVPRRLFGRDELVAQIHRHLDDTKPVLLHGMGGMGKTSLAATVADQRIENGKGDVIWLEAGNEDAQTLCEAIARTFNQQEAIARKQGEDRYEAVREMLLGKRALLVLDNVWNTAALRDFKKAIPRQMPLLVTSRQQATADGALIDVSALDAEDALNLLGYHADKVYDGDESADALCQMLGAHPFALEIAGKRLKMVPHLTPAQLMKSIANAPHNLKLSPELAEVRREGVKNLLDESVNELNDESRAVFTAMGSLFAPTATLELLALAMKRDIEDVEAAVMDLYQRGLAEVVPEAERIPAFYRLHDLTYSYARELFSRDVSDHSATIAAARQFIQAHLRDYDDLEFEQNNLLGAANAARRKDDLQSLIDIMKMLAVDGYLDARGHSLLFLQRLDDAIDAAETLKLDETRHYLLGKRGNVYALRGDLANALQAYEAALKLAPNPNREALCLSTIGSIRFQQSADDYDSYFERAIEIAEKNEDDVVLSHTLMNRGLAAKERGDLQAAHTHLSQAVDVADRLSIPGRLSTTLYNLGMVEVELRQFDQALTRHKRAYSIAVEEDNHFSIADACSGMACAYHGLGERDQAQEFFDKALVLYRKMEASLQVAWVVNFSEKEGYTIKPESD